VSKLISWSVAAALAAVSGASFADTAETNGGIKIKTDDGRFEASIGARLHFDANLIDLDNDSTFGSGALRANNPSGVFFRRIYLTLKGKAYGWSWKIENDFCGQAAKTLPNNNLAVGGGGTGTVTVPATTTDQSNTCRESNFQYVYAMTNLGPGEIMIGQSKPFRSMEDIMSSNEITMVERSYVSSAGIYSGREFQDGVFYLVPMDMFTAGAAVYSLRSINGTTTASNGSGTTEGVGWNARATFAPIATEKMVAHVGVNYSGESFHNNNSLTEQFGYFGRLGGSEKLLGSGDKTNIFGAELAGMFGPVMLQGEWAQLRAQDAASPTVGVTQSDTVTAWYVQGSFFVTGESKKYDKHDAVFKNPKPNAGWGAVELTTRYEQAKNKDLGVGIAGICGGSSKCDISDLTFGVNYFVNPNVRLMLNYILGEQKRAGGADDKPHTLAARFQLAF
jgi:phosphate-selective porin OprO/OprP